MSTLVHDDSELVRRTHELDVQTHRDKARFAALVISVLVIVAALLALGLAQAGWLIGPTAS